MATSFLLRYQEQYVRVEAAGEELRLATSTKILGEKPDRAAMPTLPLAIPLAAGTTTRIRGESPDHSFEPLAATALPREQASVAKETLTLTFVHAEAPRNDDARRHGRRVLPLCS